MYLLKYWFRKKFPFKDYEKATVDPDPILEKRKKNLKGVNSAIRNNMKSEILLNLIRMSDQSSNNNT